MRKAQNKISVRAPRKGLTEITLQVAECLAEFPPDRLKESSLCHLFILHTSASLIIQENADPSARKDLEAYFERLVPPLQDYFTHTAEGPDDMPSHIKAVLTQTSLSIPLEEGRLALGTWQGIYLWEHRQDPPIRKIMLTVV